MPKYSNKLQYEFSEMVYKNKFHPVHVLTMGLYHYHRDIGCVCNNSSNSSTIHQTPAKGLVTNFRLLFTTTIPVFYEIQVCVFNSIGVIKNRHAFERRHTNLEKQRKKPQFFANLQNYVIENKKTKSSWQSRVTIASVHKLEQYKTYSILIDNLTALDFY